MAEVCPPRWVPRAATALTLLGLAISGYLAYEHATASTSLACPATGAIDCVRVTTSRYAQVVGVPVAYLGTGFFVVALLLVVPPAWRAPALRPIRVVVVVSGVAFVLYLLWAELVQIGAICLWCSAVHVITVALCLVVVWGELTPSE